MAVPEITTTHFNKGRLKELIIILWETQNIQGACLLQIMTITSVHKNEKPLTVFFNGGATISLITFKKAAMMNQHGRLGVNKRK